VTGRGLGLTRCVQLVAIVAEARGLGFYTGTYDHSRDRRVRSGTHRVYRSCGRSEAVARSVTFGRARPVASGPLLDSNRTPGVTRPVSSAARPVGASWAWALCDRRVRSIRPARPVNARRAASRA
jgi:hypothetical protein